MVRAVRFAMSERSHGRFLDYRSPDPNQVNAPYRDGVVMVNVAKSEKEGAQ
jgi:hypothetical protein